MRSQCGCINMEVLGRGDNAVRDGLGSRLTKFPGNSPQRQPRGETKHPGENWGSQGSVGRCPPPLPPLCV